MDGIKTVEQIGIEGKNVLVRADLEWESDGCPRQKATEEIVDYLHNRRAAKVKVIGHKGRWVTDKAEVVNNLRSDPGEESDNESLAVKLADGWDVYINEAFATSHREHCSVDKLPRLMKLMKKEVAMGPRFVKEIEMLDGVWTRQGVRVLVIGGAKAGDKARLADELQSKFDTVLRGGLLPGVNLRPDGLDIDDETIGRYEDEIKKATVAVVAGPAGKYEIAPEGTRRIFIAVAESKAYKMAGGGDTEAAIEKFGLTEKFDWISVGGGAMLEYLSRGTLPGIEALK